jgi:hypothetical protein
MVDQVIVRMKDVRPVAPQLVRDPQSCPRMWPRGLLKRPNADAGGLRLRGKCAGMRQAIDERLMTIGKLAAPEFHHQPLQAAHIEIVDELNDAHGLRRFGKAFAFFLDRIAQKILRITLRTRVIRQLWFMVSHSPVPRQIFAIPSFM